MSCFSLKQSPWSLSSGHTVRRTSPPLPVIVSPPPPAIVSVSMKIHISKALHLSSSAYGFSSAKVNNRSFECSCSSDLTPVQENNKLLDFLLFKPTHYNLGKWIFKALFSAFAYCTYTINSKAFLDRFSCPWLLSTAHIFFGLFTFTYLCSYGPQESYKDFWDPLLPVSVAYIIGLVTEMVSLSKMSAPSTYILRCAEPVFTVLLSILLGVESFGVESFPMPVYLSLLTIIAGCGLAVFSGVNLTGFMTAMMANLAFALTNILGEKGLKKRVEVTSVQYYGALTWKSIQFITPLAFLFEGPRMWAAGWEMATSKHGADAMILLLLSICIHQHFYNRESYRFFPKIEPFPFLIVNTAKKIFVIVSSIIFLGTPIPTTSLLGAASAILGIFLYSREMCKISRIQSWYL